MAESEAVPATTGSRPNLLRRRYIVDTAIQIPFIGYFMGLVILSFAVFYFLFTKGYADYLLTLKEELPPTQYATIEVQMLDARELALSIFTYCMTFSLVCAFLGGVYLSHKVAGPIYRLRKTLKKIVSEKTPTNVNFRKGDYTHGLAADFNEAMEALKH